jgi:putative acetyltransferase
MTGGIQIEASVADDEPAVLNLYRAAFPDEDLVPLVGDLLRLTSGLLSLVARRKGRIVGHVCFTTCGVAHDRSAVALLGPLAVDEAERRRGIGGGLVRAGLGRVESDGVVQVCVLGDPDYYGRFGFAAETRILPPYPLVVEWRAAWQSLRLGPAGTSCAGRLVVPAPWLRPALWAP